MVSFFVRAIFSILLLGLAAWLVPWSLEERLVEQRRTDLLAKGKEVCRSSPHARYLFGRKALLEGRLDAAAEEFEQALSLNIVYMDAWMKRAQVEALKGNPELGRQMLMMVAGLTHKNIRWKWDQALLARDLGLEDLFMTSLNTLILKGRHVNDALWLIEDEEGHDTDRVIEKLIPENRETYLSWLMRWQRVDSAIKVWQALDASRQRDRDLELLFIHFLISNGRINLARELWSPSANAVGITNPGFEEPLPQMGFNWRFTDRKGEWQIRDTSESVHSGDKALEIRFSGTANSNFSHIFQLVPVSPGKAYRLTYWWKFHRISSDEGVFVEVLGKDFRKVYQKGRMALGTEDWRQEELEFSVPEDCHAVIIRLRRHQSRRFDNKIGGTLLLDDFSLQPLENV